MILLAWVVLVLVAAERLAELFISQRHTKVLLAEGAFEVGRCHYPLIVAVHTLWIAALFTWAATRPVSVAVPWLAVYLAIQILRVWVMASLGRYWTTRIIVAPQAPLIRTGPYRFLRHPNYVVVVAEIIVLPMVFGAWQIAALFTVLNAIALWIRIRAENQALAPRAALSSAAGPTTTAPPSDRSSATLR